MALISCPECGKEISDKAFACPHCGNPMNSQPQQIPQPQQEEFLCCPKCGSRELHAEHKGFSGGKALIGAVAVGGLGLLAGTIGSRDTQITCLKCGNKFKAGEAKVVRNNTSNVSKTEAEILDKIKQGKLIAVKWYKETYNCDLKEAKDAVEEVMAKHVGELGNASGTGCSVIVLIGIGLTLGTIALL